MKSDEKPIHATFGINRIEDIGPVESDRVCFDSFTIGDEARSVSVWALGEEDSYSLGIVTPNGDSTIVVTNKQLHDLASLIKLMLMNNVSKTKT